MSSSRFLACLADTRRHEGGYSTNRADPGNWTGGKVGKGELKGTKAGIAASSHPNLDIKNLTDAQIAQIYEAEYWRVVRGDDLPAGVDLTTFDYGVNSGNARSIKALQKASGTGQDGKVGPATLAAVRAKSPTKLIQTINDARLGFLQGLTNWTTFGKGWGARVGDIRARSLLMAGAAIADLQAIASNDNKKAQADEKGATAVIAAGTGSGTGAVTGSVPSDQFVNFNWTTVVGLAVAAGVLVVCGVVLKRRAQARRAMADATLAVMAEAA
ncbi:glycoside hydrolase family 108 protein [Kaistia sp. MMO-174]|uniref:glycoside hydrolase family 108 protein n=1 Tax=Kaistia sp. MMO-174 TaxID=3081256 RepID=UPI00301A6EB4